jgi:hypothetical protein
MDATPEEMFMDSKLAGAAFRGLPKSAVTQPENGFRYINSLYREYSTEPLNITSVEFDISRYGEFTESIIFDSPVSEKKAIEIVEAYLSEPLTEEYFNKIKSDMFHDDLPWEDAKQTYHCRGDCLTDARFLEDVDVTDGVLTLLIGS